MQEVYPISHNTVYPYIGRRVSAVTHDGRHFIGTIKGVEDGKLIVEDCTFDRKPLTLSSVRSGKPSKKQKRSTTRSKHKARLSSYYDGYGYDSYGGGYGGYGGGCGFGGDCFFFPFAILASLFILPFFFI